MGWQIAIDGPAGAGKTTIAKMVAQKLEFLYIDSGALYRAVTLKAMELNIDLESEESYSFIREIKINLDGSRVFLDDKEITEKIRSIEVSNNVSIVSKFEAVRSTLVKLQQEIASNDNVVINGRDIGTVVLPNADLKIFLDADIEERARRRMLERANMGVTNLDFDTIIEELKMRDLIDSNRDISPLKKADDAIVIDTSYLSVEEVINEIVSLVIKRGYKMENEIKNIEATEEVVGEEEKKVATEEVKKTRKRTTKKTEDAVEETTPTEKAVPVKKAATKKAAKPAIEAIVETETTVEVAVEKETAPVVEVTLEEKTAEVVNDNVEETSQGQHELRELQLVKGIVIEVYDAIDEKRDSKGNVLRKGKDERALVKLENGQEGYLFKKDVADIAEDEELFDRYLEGDEIEAVVKKVFPDGGKVLLSTELLKARNELKKFEEIIANHEVFTAKVTKNIKVGLLLKYNEYSCLLPVSQVNYPEDKLSELVGKELEVAPIRVDYNRIRLIVSNTVALAIKGRSEKTQFIEKLAIGQVYEGVVKNIESYGAFVEIARGIEGLLHISELAHNRVFKVDKILNIGDTVKVQIIKLEKNHIGLSRKALIPNHWQIFTDDKSVGCTVTGKVTEINASGLVLELAPEVTGFLPKSEVSWERDIKIEEEFKVDDNLEVKVIEIDPTKKRIILSKKQLADNPWVNLKVKSGDTIDVTVTKILKDGVKFAYDGISGNIFVNNLGDYTLSSLKEGQLLNVKVRVVDIEKTKLIVTAKTANMEQQYHEKESYAKYMKTQEKVSNTFGDLIGDRIKNFKK